MTSTSPQTIATGGRRTSGWLLTTILAGALALRIAYSVAAHVVTFDSATVGLMALNILDGKFPLFFYGQNYMGSLEAYVAAVMVALFGVTDLSISLSPILFSLIWVWACYLLYRELAGAAAGLVAAAVAAFSGIFVIWWNVDNNGGYAPVLALGTLALWLCARIANRPPDAPRPWGLTIILGLVSAVGIWCNLSVAPFLVVGAMLLIAHLVSARFAPGLLVCFAVGGCLAVMGFVPSLWNPQDCLKLPMSRQFILTAAHLQQSWRMLISANLPALIFWDMAPEAANGFWGRIAVYVYPLMSASLAAAGLLYLWRLFVGRGRYSRLHLLVPLAFLAVFSLLYFPHWMSVLRAPRYFMNGWAMLSIGVWALGATDRNGRIRRWVLPLLFFWLASQVAADGLFMQKMRPFKAEKMAKEFKAIQTAESLGLTSIQMVGDPVFGYRGHILSYFSKNRLRFVSATGERYQPSAQAAEADPHAGIAVLNHHGGKLAAGLTAAGVRYRAVDTGWLTLAYDMTVPDRPRRLIPGDTMQITVAGGSAAALGDRDGNTVVTLPPPSAESPAPVVSIDLGRVITIDSLWLWAPDIHQHGLPEGYRISGSVDGRRFDVWREVADQIATYTNGTAAYAQGYFGILECRFKPRPARYLRLKMTRANPAANRFAVAEIYLFQAISPPDASIPTETSAKQVMTAATARGVDFTVADRWLSARIIAAAPPDRIVGPYPALPRCNPYKFAFTREGRTIVPRSGLALAPSVEVADECVRLLVDTFGPSAVAESIDCGRYRLLVCGPPDNTRPPAQWSLFWNGHSLVKTRNPDFMWPRL